MKPKKGYYLLFGINLLALAAMGVWWTVFFMQSLETERKARLGELLHAAAVKALIFGHSDAPPRPGALEGPVLLEIVSSEQASQSEIFAPLMPNHPHLGVRPQARIMEMLEQKIARRRLMVVGEGVFLFLLIAICTFMLYRLVKQEHRQFAKMENFVASVTHEMKTPVCGIKSMLETFVANKVPSTEKSKLYAMGLKESERLEHMIENILLSGRLRDNQLVVQNEVVALKPFLERFIEHRRRFLVDQSEALQMVWEIDQPDINVLADPHAMRIVLENLFDNAIKYSGSSIKVILRVEKLTEAVRFSVEDQGIGFTSEQAKELFSPFSRLTQGNSEIKHGTGLGLSIVQALVKRMDGESLAFSAGLGQGSRFSVVLKEA